MTKTKTVRELFRRRAFCSADKAAAVFVVDLGDFLLAVDIGLVEALNAAAAEVAAGIAAVAGAAADREGLPEDVLPFLPGSVLDQDRSMHGETSFLRWCHQLFPFVGK